MPAKPIKVGVRRLLKKWTQGSKTIDLWILEVPLIDPHR